MYMLIFLEPWVRLEEGNKMTKWEGKEPYAYGKGNSVVAFTRQDLLKCNASEQQDWNARLYAQVSFPSSLA